MRAYELKDLIDEFMESEFGDYEPDKDTFAMVLNEFLLWAMVDRPYPHPQGSTP